jgi:5-deoxy-glucuronate isomerase
MASKAAWPHNTAFREGFGSGYTPITREGETELDAGIDFGIHKLAKGQVVSETHAKETAWLLMNGAAELEWDGGKAVVKRSSLFDEAPTALHVPAKTAVRIKALSDVEWGVARATNARTFEPKLFLPDGLAPEYRGRGLVQGTCLRNVRLIFDITNRKESNLVLGEVITFPGRWSTYPPHFHAQPEIYHYRFTAPQGYGHGEAGEDVYKVRQYDTLKILDCKGHSQTAAPGYGMYYIWIVRHLKDNPYTGFKYFKEHEWVLDSKNQGWKPKDWDEIQ